NTLDTTTHDHVPCQVNLTRHGGGLMQAQKQISGQPDAVRTTLGLAAWTLAWVVTVAVARFGPEYLWDSKAASWAAVAVNVAAGIGWIVAHARYLRGIDELQRKIMQDALVVTLGVV